MATKKYDIVAKVGTYMKNGEEKNKYQNVGAVLEGQNGPFIVMNRTFNPAGVPCDPGKESVILSLFGQRLEGNGPSHNEEDVPF